MPGTSPIVGNAPGRVQSLLRTTGHPYHDRVTAPPCMWRGRQENAMRALLLGLIVASGLGLAAHPSQAAMPAGAMAIDQASEAGAFAEPVDCRRYPHRHSKARPHGLGFGCPKKARPAR